MDSCYNQTTLYVDMDFTISASMTFERECQNTMRRGFFINRFPMTDAINKLYGLKKYFGNKIRLVILSAAPTSDSIKEKDEWLDLHCPGLFEDRKYISWTDIEGINKANYINIINGNSVKENMRSVLIDDSAKELLACNKHFIKHLHASALLIDKITLTNYIRTQILR